MGSYASRSSGGKRDVLSAIKSQIDKIINPQFDFEGSEKQKAWANDIVKQVYEGMIPKQIKDDISVGERYSVKINEYEKGSKPYNNAERVIQNSARDATANFNKIKDSVNYEKAVYDGALKQLTASEIIGKRGNFKAGMPLNKAVYRNTYKSAIEKGKTPPTVEQGIKHFLKAFKNADEF